MNKKIFGYQNFILTLSLLLFFTASNTAYAGLVPTPKSQNNSQIYDNYNVFIKPTESTKSDITNNEKQSNPSYIKGIETSNTTVKNTLLDKIEQDNSVKTNPVNNKKKNEFKENITDQNITVFDNMPESNISAEHNDLSNLKNSNSDKRNIFKSIFNKNRNISNETLNPDKLDAYEDTRNQAKVLYNANNLQEALETFSKIPDADKVSDDWLYLANIAQDMDKITDATFYLKKAIQNDELNYKAHYNLGNLYLADDKINMALDEYNKALKIKKDFAYAHYNKGCCYLKKNSLMNAKYEFGLAIKSNPSVPSFYYNLAYTYKLMNKEKKAQDALDLYEKLMEQ